MDARSLFRLMLDDHIVVKCLRCGEPRFWPSWVCAFCKRIMEYHEEYKSENIKKRRRI